jgi:UDP-2-acetamido-3-amino-2,3-dideoxy-glucuronate N-acetyltransferase
VLEAKDYFSHSHALVESPHIGKGTRIWAFAHVMKGAQVGEDCNLGDHVFVESKVRIGNKVTIKNGVALWDGVVLEDCVFVGPNAVFTNDKHPRIAYQKKPEEFLPTIVREGASIGANVTICLRCRDRSARICRGGSRCYTRHSRLCDRRWESGTPEGLHLRMRGKSAT